MSDASFLTQSPLFRNLDEGERALILGIGRLRRCGAGEVLFREGDAGDGLYILLKGTVRISRRHDSGEEALAIMEPSAFFGEMALIDGSNRAADAIVNEDSELFFLPLQELAALIEGHHPLALKILYALCRTLAQRLRETNERYMNVFTLAHWGGGPSSGLIHLP